MPQRKTTTHFIISRTTLFSHRNMEVIQTSIIQVQPYTVYVSNLVQYGKYVISHGMYCTLRSFENTFCLSNSHKIRSFIAKCNSTNIY